MFSSKALLTAVAMMLAGSGVIRAADRLAANDWLAGTPLYLEVTLPEAQEPGDASLFLLAQLEQPLPPPQVETKRIQPGAEEQVQEPGLEAADLGPQILLQRYPHARRFEVSSDSQYLYTSNVLLTDGDIIAHKADSLWYQTFTGSYTLPQWAGLSAKVYAQYALVRYQDSSQFDFDGNTAGLSLGYSVKDWFTLYGDFSAEREYFRQGDNEFFKMFDTRAGIWRRQTVSSKVFLYYGYQFDWRAASPSELTRADDAFYGGVNVTLLDRLTGDLFYRFRVQEYLQTSRTDLDHLVSLTVTYAVTRYISLRTYAAYGSNDSNVTGRDYTVFNGGVGMNLLVKF